jgi:hypothetical protein
MGRVVKDGSECAPLEPLYQRFYSGCIVRQRGCGQLLQTCQSEAMQKGLRGREAQAGDREKPGAMRPSNRMFRPFLGTNGTAWSIGSHQCRTCSHERTRSGAVHRRFRGPGAPSPNTILLLILAVGSAVSPANAGARQGALQQAHRESPATFLPCGSKNHVRPTELNSMMCSVSWRTGMRSPRSGANARTAPGADAKSS